MKEKVKIIAEVGSNHNGKLETALELIAVAAECGADVVKFQGFIADDLMAVDDPNFGKLKRLEVPKSWYPLLIEQCVKHGVEFLSTATSFTTLQWMEEYSVSQYKVASCNITHIPLIDRLVEINKPIIISTGLASLQEIVDLSVYLEEKGFKKYSFLHCVSRYPMGPAEARLKNIFVLNEILHCPIGFSDHSHGCHLAVAAVALGAQIIEKHISMDKKGIGMDHDVAVLPDVFRMMCQAVRDTEKAVYVDFASNQEAIFEMRRSLHFSRNMSKGEMVNRSALKITRPENGLLPSEIDYVIGRTLTKDVKASEAVKKEILSS